MKQAVTWGLLVATVACFGGSARAWDLSSLDAEFKDRLTKGEVVVLPRRPDETTEVDERFVTVSKLLTGTRREIWEVINDKEDAEKFLDGVLESEILEKSETEMVVSQKTHVGGPKGAYQYTLRYKLTPMSRSAFTFVKGDMRNVIGSWWIMEGPDETTHLVVYSLFIDPGMFAPQFVVKRGMKSTMPSTVKGVEAEVLRRRSAAAEDKE